MGKNKKNLLGKNFNLPTISVVSPVYNNATVLEKIIKEIQTVLSEEVNTYEILLIDDASTDNSQNILREKIERLPNVHVLYHTTNKGTAITYRELYDKARYDGVVLFSLDGEWDPQDIRLFIHEFSRFNIVIGRRKIKAYSLGRKIVSFLFNWLPVMLFGVRTYDAGSIKLLQKEIITTIPIISRGVFDEAERIIRAEKAGYTVGFVYVNNFPSNKKRGVMDRLPLIIEAVLDMTRVRLSIK